MKNFHTGKATSDVDRLSQPTSRASRKRIDRVSFEVVHRKLDEYFVAIEKAEDAGGKVLKLMFRAIITVALFASTLSTLFWIARKAVALTLGGMS